MAESTDEANPKNPELIRLLRSITKSDSTEVNSNLDKSGVAEWSSEEVNHLLKLLIDYDYLPQINLQNEEIYTKLSKGMTNNGYKRSKADIKNYCKKIKRKLIRCQSQDYQVQDSEHDNPILETEIIVKEEDFNNILLDSSNDDCMLKNSKERRRSNWSFRETECVVEAFEKYGMPNRTNLRRFCFIIVDHLKQNGFIRSEEQVQIKMKQLRALYNQVVRKNLNEADFPLFRRIKVVMQTKKSDAEFNDNDDTLQDLSRTIDGDETTNHNVDDEDLLTKRGRQIWTNKEVQVLLKFIEDNNIVTGKQLRKMCNKAVDNLATYGFNRSSTQILIRWKNTKALYWATFRKKLLHPERECSFFHQLHGILNRDDSTYETRTLDTVREDEFVSQSSEINETSSFGVHSVSRCDTFKEDDVVNFQNNSNSSDSFANVVNITSKRFPNLEVSVDPLEHTNTIEIIPSSPKRSRTTEPTHSNRLSTACSVCSVLDPTDHYCISLAHSIKHLDARKQAKLKIEIQQLMYKAEFDPNF